ncbi:hypothetical protein EC988_007462 [Linderina pennispora]|nr:hypothetical protein EC988_007462 [Linderina pennispora]
MIAIGISNIFGPFFGAYPVTGSFSRTAVNSKAGVRTPFAGVITGVIVVISIYALPAVLYYVSNAVLAAVIIHAVGNLVTSPKTIKGFWHVSPFEFLIFWAGVAVSVFSSIDNGIYTTVGASAALMLFRIAKARGKFVGQIEVCDTLSDSRRNVYIPLDHTDGSNPAVDVKAPPGGIFIYRLNEGYLYPNAVHFTDHMVEQIMQQTRPGILNPYGSLGNRPWNDPGPRHKTESDIDTSKPELRSVILDFTGVSHVDITSVQNLLDVRQQLDRHADCSVSWHFVGIKSVWTRRALIAAGFGAPASASQRPVFTVANVGLQQENDNDKPAISEDPNSLSEHEQAAILREVKTVPVMSIDRPFFHIDMGEALAAAKNQLAI